VDLESLRLLKQYFDPRSQLSPVSRRNNEEVHGCFLFVKIRLEFQG